MGIADADIFEPTGPALVYSADDETWPINAGVTVTSQNDAGVASSQNGSVLINNGNIFGGNTGASFSGDSASITNGAGRHIVGGEVGISLKGGGATVVNHGTGSGFTEFGVFFDNTSSNGELTNHGEIYGRDIGVGVVSSFGGGTIHNFGSIRSDTFGVGVNLGTDSTTILTNAKGAVIQGAEAAIFLPRGGSSSPITARSTATSSLWPQTATSTTPSSIKARSSAR